MTDADGKTHLDLLGGIAVSILGHRRPRSSRAVTAQLNTLGHASNLYATEPGVARWPRPWSTSSAPTPSAGCSSATPAPRPTGWPSNSKADRAHQTRCRTERLPRPHDGIAGAHRPAEQAGAVRTRCPATSPTCPTATSDTLAGRSPMTPPRCSWNRSWGGRRRRAARKLPGGRREITAAPRRPAGARRGPDRCRAHRAFFAHQHDGVTPDIIVTLAKGPRRRPADQGVPGHRPAADLMAPGLHGSTFGGNPVCAAAALAVLRCSRPRAWWNRPTCSARPQATASSRCAARWSTTSGVVACCAGVVPRPPCTESSSRRPRGMPGSSSTPPPGRDPAGAALIITEAQIDSFPPRCRRPGRGRRDGEA